MLTIKNESLVIDGKPTFVYSGEMHYFRIPKSIWKQHIAKAKRAGLNTISSYIPWILHEYEEGKFDFTGKTCPERDLVTFIKLVKEAGLYFIVRTGPVSNAELLNEGLPKWLLKKHPEICTAGKGLPNLPHVTLVSYHNPLFKEYVEKWYAQLLPIIKENQITQKGNIILVQLCNEIGMSHWVNKTADYSQQTELLYRQFLQDKYHTIDTLNNLYSTKYRNFDEIVQPQNNVDTFSKEVPLLVATDWMYFYCWFYATYFEFLHSIYKKHGLELPVIANIPQFYDFDVRGRGVYSPMTTIMFRNFAKYVPEIIFGGAYQMRRLDYENFHDVLITTEIVKMVSSVGMPSMCCELQFGIMRDKPKIYPSDVELNIRVSTASGLNGLNGYMFSGGTDSEELGAFGKYHEWQAPVTSEGKERAHFKSVKIFGDVVKIFGEKISQTKKHTDTAIGFYTPYYATELLEGKFIEELEKTRDLVFFDGLARLMELAGFSYSLVDIERCTVEELKNHKHLWVFSLDFMAKETQQKLFEYVESGGTLILYPKLPTKNLSYQKEELLSKNFNLKLQKEIKENTLYVDGKETLVYNMTQIFDTSAEDRVVAVAKDGSPCGVFKSYRQGNVLVLGFGLTHTFDYQIGIIKKLATDVGMKSAVEIMPDSEIHISLRKNDKFGFLFVSNYQEIPKECWIKLNLPGEKKVTRIPSKSTMNISPRTSYILPLNVPVEECGEEISIRYTTVEVLDCKKKGKEIHLSLRGSANTDAELQFNYPHKPKQVLLDNKKIPFSVTGGLLSLNFRMNADSQKLTIS